MTSRPRRRAADAGIDLSEERADEYFRLTGTPAQDLEKSKELGEYIPPWKQEVRDEKGRRRLHGAFTGGFSAGYYNTVGSKEGWVPSTFVSSRSERAARKVVRPEDFMDDEDLAALNEEQDLLEKEEEMEVIAAARAEMKNRESAVDDRPDFVSSAQEAARSENTVGARLLQKMGQLSDPTTSSNAAPSGSGFQGLRYASTAESSDRDTHITSLRDITMLQSGKKGNVRGLGYIPEITQKDRLAAKSTSIQGPKLAVGFGLGALNEVEDDDLDIYDGPKDTGQSRLAYDASHPDSNETVGKQGKKPTEPPSILTGFVPPSDRSTTEEASYLSQGANRAEEPTQVKTQSVKSDSAAAPTDPSSVFHYISQKDRERLQSITSQGPAFSPTMPFTEPHIAQAALRGFQPFAADPVKQARYHTYLQSQAFPGSGGESLTPLPSQKMDEFRKEVDSYAKAAQLFKPMTGAMANRFTSSASGAAMTQALHTPEGLHKPSAADYAKKPPPPEPEVEKKEETPKAQAARLGMYGPLTRETKPWLPARLLCKRFGVKDPNPEPVVTTASGPTEGKPTPAANPHPESSLVPKAVPPDASSTTVAQPSGGQGNIREVAQIEPGETRQISSTPVQPAIDIYNTVFANDNEVSDDEEKVKDELEGNAPASNSRTDSSTKASGPDRPAAEKIDLNTFKPTFVPRSERDKNSTSRKEKKDKKKAVLVSFEMDEEAGEKSHLSHKKSKDRPKKKRRHKRAEGDEDEVMWAEKPRPESAKEVELDVSSTDSPAGVDSMLHKGRKRAIDFM